MNSLNLKIKKICVLLALLIFIFSLTACENENSQAPAFLSGNIHIVTREDGSGTRSAFIELFKIEETDEYGGKIDNTVLTAETINSTSVMLATVASSLKSIGYTSMGSLSGTVKTVSIDGITPDFENVKNGSYKISRPFGIIFKSSISAAAQDFINFIFSENGQKTIEENGYISVEQGENFLSSKPKGKIVISGSSSVAPVMEKLAEKYSSVNSNAEIQIQQSDSSTGISSVSENLCDIGMISRELKSSEKKAGKLKRKLLRRTE